MPGGLRRTTHVAAGAGLQKEQKDFDTNPFYEKYKDKLEKVQG